MAVLIQQPDKKSRRRIANRQRQTHSLGRVQEQVNSFATRTQLSQGAEVFLLLV